MAACALGGLVLALVTTPLVRMISVRYGLVDRAAQFHDAHTVAVPRMGGIVLFCAFALLVAGILVFSCAEETIPVEIWTLAGTSLAMFVLGFWDDLHPLGARLKLGVQVAVSLAAYFGGLQIDNWTNPLGNQVQSLGLFALPVTVLWLVAVTNLINLIDGVDGLAAGVSLMMMIILGLVGFKVGSLFGMLVAAGMAGTLFGFLFYNFPPARIFMGDGGAYFVGFLIAGLAILSSSKGTVAAALIVPFIALGLPIIDATFALIRRGLQGLPIFRADRRHIHHRLAAMGFSQRRVVWTFYAISAGFGVLALAGFIHQGRVLPILAGVLLLVTLLAAKAFGFVQDWYKLGYVFSAAMHRRRETRFALALGRWLEMESERCKTVADLWRCFRFMLERLGFDDVRSSQETDVIEWRSVTDVRATMGDRMVMIHYGGNRPVTIELRGPGVRVEADLLLLLAELAAEAWLKAIQRWNELNSSK
jgi:UDP-GlcNAc:undecaprenyl-phosphate GlcNAc-1-phosphate transferase